MATVCYTEKKMVTVSLVLLPTSPGATKTSTEEAGSSAMRIVCRDGAFTMNFQVKGTRNSM